MAVTGGKREGGMRAKSGSSNGACELVSKRKKFVPGEWDMPGGRHRRHRERHCGCKGRRLLVLNKCQSKSGMLGNGTRCLRRLKLVTGVDISTRPVRRPGSEGKAKKQMSLITAAEVNRMAFRRSMTMMNVFFFGSDHEMEVPYIPYACCTLLYFTLAYGI